MRADATLRPLQLDRRVEWLDALRGFALLGILLINIAAFSGYVFIDPSAKAQLPFSGADKILDYLVHALVEAKFYSLFSFLFGLGFAVQLQRAEVRGGDFQAVFRRRLGWLLAFGLAHAFLIWFGDILNIYALLGFVLLWFRRFSARTLLLSAVFFLTAPIWIYAMFLLYAQWVPSAPAAPPGSAAQFQAVLDGYAHGGYGDVVHSNGLIYAFAWIRRIYRFQLLRIVGMFLLGAWAGKVGLVHARETWLPVLRRWLLLGVLIGVPMNLAFAALGGNDALLPASAQGLLSITLGSLGIPLLTLAYVAAFALYWTRPRGSGHLLVASGRMALSHYLCQSVIAVTVFYGVGFGWFGKISFTSGILIAVAIYLLLAMACRAWLSYFPQGPMEALWRRLTYSRAQVVAG
jgi:uncharacterized protein